MIASKVKVPELPEQTALDGSEFVNPFEDTFGKGFTVTLKEQVDVLPHPSVFSHVIVELPIPKIAPLNVDDETEVTGPEEVNVNVGDPVEQVPSLEPVASQALVV